VAETLETHVNPPILAFREPPWGDAAPIAGILKELVGGLCSLIGCVDNTIGVLSQPVTELSPIHLLRASDDRH
jgi:hypothetical protein